MDEEDLHHQIFGGEGIVSVLESNQGGTVCFDEISFMPLSMQFKFMKVLKERRLAGSEITLDVRFIFTSSENIEEMTVEKGEFNGELYSFITSSTCQIDPLRKRNQDIGDLLSHFLRKECRKQGLLLKEFSEEAKEQLVNYDWPGNINELQKAVEKAVLYNPKAHVISKLTNGATPIIDITKSSIQGLDSIPHARDFSLTLKERVLLVEREMIIAEIRRCKGNKSKAAKEMGISREALRKKLLTSDKVALDLNEKDTKKAA